MDMMIRLAGQFGAIFRFVRPGGSQTVLVSSLDLLDELCDESRFWKVPPPALKENTAAADVGPPGLFIAATDDPNWELAHRVLVPAFGPLSIQNMFDGRLSST